MSDLRIVSPANWYQDYARDLWEGTKHVRVYWRNEIIDIPAFEDCTNFVCDMYSIPRFMRAIYPQNIGDGNLAAYIHDWTRRFRSIIGMTCKQTDRLFLDAMRYYNIPHAKLFYIAVRLQAPFDSGGDGIPPSDVRHAMRDREDDWGLYARRVTAMYNER